MRNYSRRLIDVIEYSREEAVRLQNSYIGPEHLMLGIIRDGDMIDIDIPSRSISLRISDEELASRLAAWHDHRPRNRDRVVPLSLKAYSLLVSSADQGAVRIVPEE